MLYSTISYKYHGFSNGVSKIVDMHVARDVVAIICVPNKQKDGDQMLMRVYCT